jgi:mannose-6-phosphate isomerase-like protein (cupin superfamily)
MQVIRALVALFFASLVPLSLAQNARPRHFTPSKPPSATDARRIPDLTDDACYHQMVGNQRVRVFRVQVAPHQSTLLDRHDLDYLIVSLGTNHMGVAGAASQFRLDLQDGEMQVMKGGWTHRITNLGDAPLRFIEVDVRPTIDPAHPICGLAGTACSDGRFGKTDQGSYTFSTLFETSTVKLKKVELDAGVSLPAHGVGRDSLVLALTDSDLRSADKLAHLRVGDATWYAAGPTALDFANVGKSTARFLVVEMK